MKPLKFNIPKHWNELSDWQLKNIVFILMTRDLDIKSNKKILRYLLNIKWWHIKSRSKLFLLLRNVPLSELRNHYQFIFKDNNRTVFPSGFKYKKQHLEPPMDRIINLTADEFAAADGFHVKWRETKNVEYLQYLAATLYTPHPRPQFDKLSLHETSKPFKKLSIKKLMAIEITYFGCKNNLARRFKKVFPKTNSKTKQKYGFGKVILEMAHGDLSKHDQIKNVNIFTFLEQFQQDIINAQNKKAK